MNSVLISASQRLCVKIAPPYHYTALPTDKTPAKLYSMSVRSLLLFLLPLFPCTAADSVPKVWADRDIADFRLPLAGLGHAPRLISEKEYYALPEVNLKTYPVYGRNFAQRPGDARLAPEMLVRWGKPIAKKIRRPDFGSADGRLTPDGKKFSRDAAPESKEGRVASVRRRVSQAEGAASRL
jgi:hypothetical protein